jgi:hypothetical protein
MNTQGVSFRVGAYSTYDVTAKLFQASYSQNRQEKKNPMVTG